MNRPWKTWLLFGLCLIVVAAAMGWVSLTALRLEQAEREARRQAAVEESVRLALWRMDSAMSTLVARESARPYFAYAGFFPAERAYANMYNPVPQGEVLLPSPLLKRPQHVLVHFQIGPDGDFTSPQVPRGKMLGLAVDNHVTRTDVETARVELLKLKQLVSRSVLLAALPSARERLAAAVRMPGTASSAQVLQQEAQQQVAGRQVAQKVSSKGKSSYATQQRLNVAEWQARNRRQQEALKSVKQSRAPQRKGKVSFSKGGKAQSDQQSQSIWRDVNAGPAQPRTDISEGWLRLVWVRGALLLARRVVIKGRDYVQGCRLDWESIRAWLIDEAKELLPNADLKPLSEAHGATGARSRMLASLPVVLAPGGSAVLEDDGASPVLVSLGIAWACVLLAAAAVGVLLLGVISLSERRAAFVSAVTHEMRTPLTTFRMYTEMLTEGMVPDEAKRSRYLETLRGEADRLGHLVENVLAYARLERGRPGGRAEDLSLLELLDRMWGRLSQRAEQAGLDLQMEGTDAAFSTRVRVDSSAVEQVLFNLVDNACKYAAAGGDKQLHLGARAGDGLAVLSLRDHGPGIPKGESRRLFQPFCKSARDAANSAPGVGLGLALSRRRARRMGGDLLLKTGADEGACFELTLPAL